ncbi:hypothetical protein ACFQ1L_32000 [Phytohabitans flavus]|uniref:hypothetical protein n=1 Tax=Phytohabitans flavus TaxID=1076124 RepID=UPI0036322D4F
MTYATPVRFAAVRSDADKAGNCSGQRWYGGAAVVISVARPSVSSVSRSVSVASAATLSMRGG